jgi:hypothetical protein
MEHVIWNARNGGWLTNSATYSSELQNAKRLKWAEALAFCKTHYAHHPGDGMQGDFGMIPVALSALVSVQHS